ncbi:DMT family transporter [Ammoniphilus sp. CFH 90114]|uniref:DMT family transporter n=1 Tax=Ammoniphilus sp. CFH 90114 TaxID=2493665 RepID=UPI00100F3E77|nr:DMT family transporter [Ammoniphilus sp. CFH 90114]RXT02855.1 DMT family transporter [Ammoniphilus sp. CFH 90114]
MMNGKGIYAALSVAMLFWGLNVIAVKVLVTAYPSLTITAIRVTIAGLCVLLYTWWAEGFRNMNRQEWFYLFLAALTGVFGHHIFLAFGLKETTGSNGSLILSLNPLTTVVLAYLFLGERLTRLRSIGVALGFAGVLTIVLRGADSGLPSVHLGDVLVFLGMLSQSVSFLAIRKILATVSVNQVTSYSFLMGGGLLFLTGYGVEAVSPLAVFGMLTPGMWLLLFTSAMIATALGGWIWNRGIRELGPGQTAVFINMTPFYGLVGSALFLGESIGIAHMIGFVLIVGGVLLGSGWYEANRGKWARRKVTHNLDIDSSHGEFYNSSQNRN